MRYQETWIKGKAQGGEYQRPCEDRYMPIMEFAGKYTRPFSVFDLGANLGYFSIRLAEDYPDCNCTMMDTRPELQQVLEANELPNIMWLNMRITALGLTKWADSEKFDVVLALSVLHHFGNGWKSALTGLQKLGQWVIVEIPAPDDTGSLNGHLGGEMQAYINTVDGAELIGEFPSHKSGKIRAMYLLPGIHNPITVQSVDAKERGAPPLHGVHLVSDFDKAEVRIEHGDISKFTEIRPFIPGMNLWNFIKLKGAWPTDTKSLVATEIVRMDVMEEMDRMNLADEWHDDLRPWNFILTGEQVHAIDTGNKAWRTSPEVDGLEKCLDMMERGK